MSAEGAAARFARLVGCRLPLQLAGMGSVCGPELAAAVCEAGGLGTLEGFCELLTWAQLGLHQKPCAILDVAGYFQPLVRFLDHMAREGFLAQAHRDMVLVDEDPEGLLRRLRAYQPPDVPRWIEAGQT